MCRVGFHTIPYHLHDIIWCILHNQKISLFVLVDSAQQVGFSNTGSGRVWGKIPGSGSGLGWVGVLKYTIRYFRVFFTFEYFQVFLGIFGYKISSLFLEAESQIMRFSSFIYWRYSFKEPPTTNKDCRDFIPEIPSHVWKFPKCWVYPKYRVIPNILGYLLPDEFQNWIRSGRISKKYRVRVPVGHCLWINISLQ